MYLCLAIKEFALWKRILRKALVFVVKTDGAPMKLDTGGGLMSSCDIVVCCLKAVQLRSRGSCQGSVVFFSRVYVLPFHLGKTGREVYYGEIGNFNLIRCISRSFPIGAKA